MSRATFARWRWIASIALCIGRVASGQAAPTSKTVLFVCEHGTVKSLLAKVLFEQYAKEAGLQVRAESRGTHADSIVPEWMRSRLALDRVPLGNWRPQTLVVGDLASASYVVSFDVPAAATAAAQAPRTQWDSLPSVTQDYTKARDAIRARVRQLVDSLKRAEKPVQDCDRGGVLSAGGIGPLRIGMTIDSLARTCRIIERRYVIEYTTTRYSVRVGADTVQVWEANARVGWIQTTSPIHRTRDSLGVGSSVGRLLMLPEVTGGPGDGADAYVVYPTSGEHCGLTFWLDAKTAEVMGKTKGDVTRALGMRGGNGVVVEINIRGACPQRR